MGTWTNGCLLTDLIGILDRLESLDPSYPEWIGLDGILVVPEWIGWNTGCTRMVDHPAWVDESFGRKEVVGSCRMAGNWKCRSSRKIRRQVAAGQGLEIRRRIGFFLP